MSKKSLFFLFSTFSIVLIISLLCGCSEEDKAENILGENGSDIYTGFMKMKGGEWAEYTTENGRTRNEFIGTDTYNGRKCTIMEFESIESGEKLVTQIWIDSEKSEPVLYVQKIGNEVYKLNFQNLPKDIPSSGDETPVEYSATKKVRNDKYTTPTGKTVNVAVFKDAYGEDWISAEVPFGIVKIIDQNGVVNTELYDFGTSGAKRDISKEEAENAKSLFDFDFEW